MDANEQVLAYVYGLDDSRDAGPRSLLARLVLPASGALAEPVTLIRDAKTLAGNTSGKTTQPCPHPRRRRDGRPST